MSERKLSPAVLADYFGFRRMPFLGAGLDGFFNTPCHEGAYRDLREGIQRRQGLVVLTGQPGVGKTLLLRKLFHEVPEHFRLIRAYSTNLTFDELLNFICDYLGLSTLDADQNKKIKILKAHLQSSLENGSHVVLLIDDAHELHENVLRQLLHLLQSESEQFYLPTVLSGESVLEKLLAHQQDVLASHFEISYVRLARLGSAEVTDFIRHQLQIAGGSASEALFPAPVMQRIVHHARGIPQLVNAIGYHALLIAYLSEQNSVFIEMVEEAAGDALCDYLQLGTEPGKQSVLRITEATEAVGEPLQGEADDKEAVELGHVPFFEWQHQSHNSVPETIPQFAVDQKETDSQSTAVLAVADKLPADYKPGSLQDELESLQALVRASRSGNARGQPRKGTSVKRRGLLITLCLVILFGAGIAYLEYKRYDYVDFLADSTVNLAAKLKEAGTTALSFIKTSTQSWREQNHDEEQSASEEPGTVAPALLSPGTLNSPDGATSHELVPMVPKMPQRAVQTNSSSRPMSAAALLSWMATPLSVHAPERASSVVVRQSRLRQSASARVIKPVLGATDADTMFSVVDYLRRGDRMLTAGDVISARLFYEAALTTGDSEAITAIGRTFDPVSLTRMGLGASHANPIKAAQWYLKAAKAGDPEAYKHREGLRRWLTQSSSLTETQKRTLRRLLNEPIFSSTPVTKSAGIG